MFKTEKYYIEILNYSPRTGMEALEDRALHFLTAKRAEFSKILNNLSISDKKHNAVKKLKSCYKDICLALKRYKDRRGIK